MNWDDVRLFLALARLGSARAASEFLGLSHTTISRRADQLESDLGSRLFDRDVSGFRLTAAGETMLSSAVRAEDALLTAERQLQGHDSLLTGEITVTTADIIASYLMMPGMADFARRYPEIDLNVLVSYDPFNLSRREADVAIRFIGKGRAPPEDLVGRKLATARSCYYASEAYLAEHDPWQKGSGARWIGWNDEERFPDWVKSSPFPGLPAYGRMNGVVLQAEAARQGMGLAVLPCFVADKIEGLSRIPQCEPYDNAEIWLLFHPDLRDVARLRTFRAFIVELFEHKNAMLIGQN